MSGKEIFFFGLEKDITSIIDLIEVDSVFYYGSGLLNDIPKKLKSLKSKKK